MSKVVSQVTDNRYTDIKVNPLLALTVYDKENHKTVPGEALSAGTIDALYFGLRMAVSQVLASDREHPLILDDPFVQFDDQRMKGVMDLLGKSGRQVLLFTCHQREMAYLEEAGIPYRSLVI